MKIKFTTRKSIASFQKKVYDVVKRIPRGKVSSYQKVAWLAGSPRAYRAVGNILNNNTDPETPCHRVVKSNKEVGGYRSGQKRKIALLKREGVSIRNEKIVL